jgi:IS5 family transposase
MARHPQLFDFEMHMERLTKAGNPLVKLNALIPWENFRELFADFRKKSEHPQGRPPYDVILMLKILILQQMYALSDDQMEFQIRDRYSFQRFLNVSIHDNIPDAKTIWLFREQLTEKQLDKVLFTKFEEFLVAQGFAAKQGAIIDAQIVEAPRQRNTKEENKEIKSGQIPADWKAKPAKLAQKDTDARWLKKNGQTYFGYKNHAVVDVRYKIIRDFTVTDASTHDSIPAPELLRRLKEGEKVYADSAYVGPEIERAIDERKLQSFICEKGYRNRPLTAKQKRRNRSKSRIRARIEHVFGRCTQMAMDFIRCIGNVRARARIGLSNLAYNMDRYVYLAE